MLAILEGIQKDFNDSQKNGKTVSLADLIVLGAGRYRIAYTATDVDETITVVDIVARGLAADSPHVSAAT